MPLRNTHLVKTKNLRVGDTIEVEGWEYKITHIFKGRVLYTIDAHRILAPDISLARCTFDQDVKHLVVIRHSI